MALPSCCPLCKSSIDYQKVITPHVYGDDSGTRAFYQCNVCDVCYQYPYLSADEESRFYTAEFESFMSNRSGDEGGWLRAESHISANEDTRLRRMKYIEPYLKNGVEILEVGCSSGFMLWPLQDLGYQCLGIEPSGIFSKFVNDKGIKVYDSIDSLQSNRKNCKFDLIMHFFVLEHISNPLSFIRAQLEMLKPGGKVIIEIPNSADPLYTIYNLPAFERFYWSIAHPWYFSEKSLRYLLKALGVSYEILLDQRYDLSNHMIWARDGKPGGMKKFTNKFGKKIEDCYKQALVESGHCDTLIAVINKE